MLISQTKASIHNHYRLKYHRYNCIWNEEQNSRFQLCVEYTHWIQITLNHIISHKDNICFYLWKVNFQILSTLFWGNRISYKPVQNVILITILSHYIQRLTNHLRWDMCRSRKRYLLKQDDSCVVQELLTEHSVHLSVLQTTFIVHPVAIRTQLPNTHTHTDLTHRFSLREDACVTPAGTNK